MRKGEKFLVEEIAHERHKREEESYIQKMVKKATFIKK